MPAALVMEEPGLIARELKPLGWVLAIVITPALKQRQWVWARIYVECRGTKWCRRATARVGASKIFFYRNRAPLVVLAEVDKQNRKSTSE